MAELSTVKLSIPAFLKMLTNGNIPAAKAMSITGKIYKTYNTPAMLADLTDLKLKAAGVDDKEERKQVMAAVRKAGYKPVVQRKRPKTEEVSAEAEPSASTSHADVLAPASSSVAQNKKSATPRKKRKRDEDRNEFLPDRPQEELEEQAYGSLEFGEVLDEEVLRPKFAIVNRAPIMTAWSFIVAERLGFKCEEALSIGEHSVRDTASVYTEMNAISKGISIGIYEERKKDGVEASRNGSQPYVDLMGRRPLYQTAKSTWLALSSGKPVAPASAYSYITRSLRQTTPFIIGALCLLAQSYTPEELNRRGFSLYADFRPEASGWGKRAEVRCAKILDLRKEKGDTSAQQLSSTGAGGKAGKVEAQSAEGIVKVENYSEDDVSGTVGEGLAHKKPRMGESTNMSLEEYEAALDADDTFNSVDLDFLDTSLLSTVTGNDT